LRHKVIFLVQKGDLLVSFWLTLKHLSLRQIQRLTSLLTFNFRGF